MHARVILNSMTVRFCNLKSDVCGGHLAVMAIQAVVFFKIKYEQSLVTPGPMRRMAVFTSVFSDGGIVCIGAQSADSVEQCRRLRMG